jgi:class 3 adenylate cyclase
MWQLLINGPGYSDTKFELPDGVTHLGRADENDIVLSGDLISRRHARLRVSGDQLVVEDLHSRNGTRVNGEPLQGTRVLRPGDTLTVGENSLSVRQRAQEDIPSGDGIPIAQRAVRRFGRGSGLGNSVVVTRNLQDSTVHRALTARSPAANGAEPAPQVPYDWLLTLYQIAERLSTARTLQAFLDEATDQVMERARATTAVVLLRYPAGTLVPASVRHRGPLLDGEVPVSDAIVDAALEKGAALAVSNARADERFSNRESVILYGADQVLCIPIRSGTTDVGVLYLNRALGSGDGLTGVLDFCNAVAHLIATGIDKFRGSGRREERLRRALERFHAPEIVERRVAELARPGRSAPRALEEKVCTVLYAELAGFATLAEALPVQRALEILNEFHERMAGSIFSFEGTVANFRGDAITGVFGAPWVLGDEPVRAVRTALAMRAEWDRTVNRLPAAERCRVRIGLHTGKVLAGIVGAESRLDFTAVGTPAAMAEWVAEFAAPGEVLITGKTLAAVGTRFEVSPRGEQVVRSPDVRTAVFEVREEDVARPSTPGNR